MSEARQVHPLAIATCAALLVLVLSVFRRILRLEGMPVTIALAFAVAGLVTLWFVAFVKRAPTQAERSRFLWWYSALLAVPTLLFVFFVSRLAWSWPGVFIIVLHLLAFPAVAQLLLSEKRMNAFLARRT